METKKDIDKVKVHDVVADTEMETNEKYERDGDEIHLHESYS